MFGVIVMNSIYPCLLIISVIILFRYPLKIRNGIAIYILGFLQYLLSYELIKIFNGRDLISYIVFGFCCTLEYLVLLFVVFMVEYENIYLATVIMMIYVPVANALMMIPVSFSKNLSKVFSQYLDSKTSDHGFYELIVLFITIISGIICSFLFRKIYVNLKNKNQTIYKGVMIALFWIIFSSAIIRRVYNKKALASKGNIVTTQIAITTVLTLVTIFLSVNFIIYAYNKYELRKLRLENKETKKWINSLHNQNAEVDNVNKKFEKIIESEDSISDLKNKNEYAEALDISLTGNILLDTLFAYYKKQAKEKNIVFEIQSELFDKDEIDKKLENIEKYYSDTEFMNVVDIATISDGVLSVFFEEATDNEGYIFVNIKHGGGKVVLNYELNKELSIKELSFGICNRYKKLKKVRSVIYLKNGILNLESGKGKQRFSVMFLV
ncbi:hypothetical protein SAMN02910289_01543 [Lachnospiraceae bacterium RM5]|nr:hypothetical protein SAMN02910289_01543 [Lachnospiraceae bacterium RM5]